MQVKLLLWEGDGLSLYYKRLEKGTYELPATGDESSNLNISNQQLQFILQGVSLQKIQYRSRYQKIAWVIHIQNKKRASWLACSGAGAK